MNPFFGPIGVLLLLLGCISLIHEGQQEPAYRRISHPIILLTAGLISLLIL